MPGPAFTSGDSVSLHPIEPEDYEFIQRGRNHPDVRVPLTDTTVRAEADVEEMLEDEEYHFLICVDERSESTEEASGDEGPASRADERSESAGDASGDERPASRADERSESAGDASGDERPASRADERSESAGDASGDEGPASRADERSESTGDASGEAASSADGDLEPVGVVAFAWVSSPGERGSLMYWVAPEHQGKGYVTEGTKLFLDYVFRECGFHKVTARVNATNDASATVLQNLGFEQEGRHREQSFVDGERVDMLSFGLLADEWLNSAA
jgi:RimJ/RimL family protein N-acetyltransferase